MAIVCPVIHTLKCGNPGSTAFGHSLSYRVADRTHTRQQCVLAGVCSGRGHDVPSDITIIFYYTATDNHHHHHQQQYYYILSTAKHTTSYHLGSTGRQVGINVGAGLYFQIFYPATGQHSRGVFVRV